MRCSQVGSLASADRPSRGGTPTRRSPARRSRASSSWLRDGGAWRRRAAGRFWRSPSARTTLASRARSACSTAPLSASRSLGARVRTRRRDGASEPARATKSEQPTSTQPRCSDARSPPTPSTPVRPSNATRPVRTTYIRPLHHSRHWYSARSLVSWSTYYPRSEGHELGGIVGPRVILSVMQAAYLCITPRWPLVALATLSLWKSSFYVPGAHRPCGGSPPNQAAATHRISRIRDDVRWRPRICRVTAKPAPAAASDLHSRYDRFYRMRRRDGCTINLPRFELLPWGLPATANLNPTYAPPREHLLGCPACSPTSCRTRRRSPA